MDNEPQNKEDLAADGKRHLKYGFGFGILSVGAIATFGAVACPLCVVAVPGFLISGALKLKKAKDIENMKNQLA